MKGEYLIEAAGLGVFMISACVFDVLLEHPGSPVYQAVPDGHVRRALMGLAMGTTAILIIYSPWGKQSGAHLNPSVTLSFFWLGRVRSADALGYMVAHTLGGLLGVVLAYAALGSWLSHPAVNFAVTVPKPGHTGAAFAAELVMSFVMMSAVLVVSRSRWQKWTGVAAGLLVASYILLEAPISGMSLNPARTFSSALPAGVWDSMWIYLVAPPLGMLLGAQAFGRKDAGCAKLLHPKDVRCIHCGAHT